MMQRQTSFIFDLDGTLVVSVYRHMHAWREALDQEGIALSVWRIHRKTGMSDGLFTNVLLRETGLDIDQAAYRAPSSVACASVQQPVWPGLSAADALQVDICTCCVVGDSIWDMLTARRPGTIGVGLLSGGYGRDELERSGAYHVYEDPADLLKHVDEVGGRDEQ